MLCTFSWDTWKWRLISLLASVYSQSLSLLSLSVSPFLSLPLSFTSVNSLESLYPSFSIIWNLVKQSNCVSSLLLRLFLHLLSFVASLYVAVVCVQTKSMPGGYLVFRAKMCSLNHKRSNRNTNGMDQLPCIWACSGNIFEIWDEFNDNNWQVNRGFIVTSIFFFGISISWHEWSWLALLALHHFLITYWQNFF